MKITSEMSRAARALLRWDQQDLADAAGLSLRTVKRAEIPDGPMAGTDKTVDSITNAFAEAGIDFERTARAIGARLKLI